MVDAWFLIKSDVLKYIDNKIISTLVDSPLTIILSPKDLGYTVSVKSQPSS